jgi:anti-sigma regulatory factor (Ser/Thr protein kinase)
MDRRSGNPDGLSQSRGVDVMSAEPPSGLPSGAVTETGDERSRPGYTASLRVPNRIESIRPAAAFLVQTARAFHVAAAANPLFDVAVTEALTNAVKHGHGGGDARGDIVCELELAPGQLTMRIFDNGPGFTVPQPRVPSVSRHEAETLRESGYGLPIIQSVFRVVRAIRVGGRFGLELNLPQL